MIAAFRARRIRLPLAAPLVTAHGVTEARDGVLVELCDDTGAHGVGEALPLPGFGLETVEETAEAIDRLGEALLAERPARLRDALALCEATAPEAPAARAALDGALHDLAARRRGVPVATLLARGAATHACVATSGFVAAREPRAAADEARRLVAHGHRALKCKIGGDLGLDVARVAAVHAAVGEGVALRLDANGAWSEHEAAGGIDLFARFAPRCCEEPMAAPSLAAWRRLTDVSPVSLAADESVCDAASARVLVRDGGVRFVVVKPAPLGGLANAREVALAAQQAGARVVVTSFLDSAVGRAGALHLAASLEGPLEPAGLATAALLADDLAATPRDAVLALPRRAGLGIALDDTAIARAAARARRGVAA